ncbi:phage virion morphogenesis protein [Salmonella enterica subsp. enterica serovar Pomona]|nr:phage virion morphogenesis protein [Salmonella enterica subsp. enterica serovar Pomona]ELZ0794996.1 phage virion morphogenesis protein [Salmonella enterica]
MSMKIEIAQDTASQRIKRAFKRLEDSDIRKDIMRTAAGALQESTEYAFEHERDPETNAPWLPWSDDWKEWREEHGYTPGKILTLSGQLAASMTTEYGDDYALIGSNKVYAAIHQWGGLPTMPPGPAAIPARPYMGLDDIGENLIYSAIQKALNDAMQE